MFIAMDYKEMASIFSLLFNEAMMLIMSYNSRLLTLIILYIIIFTKRPVKDWTCA